MKLIAIEEHFVTSAVQEAWTAAPVSDQQEMQMLHMPELGRRLQEAGDLRLQLMDESGVAIQVLSLTTPALQNLDPDESVRLAQATNDLIAATVAEHPDRFEGFATLPTPAPQEAARELERCIRKLGMKGALLCGRTREKNLDHPDFLPMLEAAAHLHVPLFIHPQMPQRAVRDVYYSGFSPQVDVAFATFGLGWHYESGIQFLRLILAGVFDRYPDLQIILGHWGEVVLFYLERLRSLSRVVKLQRSIETCLRENLYVTSSGMFSQEYLRRTVDTVGIDRILFSTDYPYQYRPGGEARRFMEELPLSAEDKEKFAHRNWERLCGASRQGWVSPNAGGRPGPAPWLPAGCAGTN